MSDKEHIKSLAREAELYRSQGLLEASKKRYQEVLQFIQNHEQFSKDKRLIDIVNKKIRTVEKDLAEIDQEKETPKLTEEVQDLIQKLFSFSKDKHTAAIEGAVVLAKFGQYEKALARFESLLKEGILPLAAAKNILRCHLIVASPDEAIVQFKRWVSGNELSKRYLKYLRGFLENILEKRGVKADLPEVAETPHERAETETKDVEETLDISSVDIQLQSGPRKGETVDLDVTFQAGNTISVMIPSKDKYLADAFEPGLRLPDMQCYSLIAAFSGGGIVSGKTRITSGPRKGDYTLDITIDGA